MIQKKIEFNVFKNIYLKRTRNLCFCPTPYIYYVQFERAFNPLMPDTAFTLPPTIMKSLFFNLTNIHRFNQGIAMTFFFFYEINVINAIFFKSNVFSLYRSHLDVNNFSLFIFLMRITLRKAGPVVSKGKETKN